MKRYVAIVAADGTKISKMVDFDTQPEAQAHIAQHGGFVFDNINDTPVNYITVDWANQTATALSQAEINADQAAKIEASLEQQATSAVDKLLGDIQRRALNVLFDTINEVRTNAGQQPITLQQYVTALNSADSPITRQQFINYVKAKL